MTAKQSIISLLTVNQVDEFATQGFIVLRQAAKACLPKLIEAAESELLQAKAPYELETDVGYPGAPSSADLPGGQTIRRLLSAAERSPVWRDWATSSQIADWLNPLLNKQNETGVWLNPNHHNCLMTKSPRYSSDTGWHQDIRYWQFHQPRLVSVWVALGKERRENGALQVIPGSHVAEFESTQFNEQKFFTTDNADNAFWLNKAVDVELDAGDVLLFDARLLHRASRNHSDLTKMSLVFTYHGVGNAPTGGTRSSRLPEIRLQNG